MNIKKLLAAAILATSFMIPVFAQAEETAFINSVNEKVFQSQTRLVLMNKKNVFSKLGKETMDGKISGQILYDAKIKGMAGDVQFVYKNFCDYPDLVLDGCSNVRAKMDASGNMYGTLNVYDSKGNLRGTICYDRLEIKKGKNAGGSYGVTLPGKQTVWLSWDTVLQNTNIQEIE